MADVVGAQLRQVLTYDGKLVGDLGGNFENDAYESVGGAVARQDRVYRASADLIYNIQLWLSAKLAYQFEKYDSNVVIDYTVNSVTLTVSVGY